MGKLKNWERSKNIGFGVLAGIILSTIAFFILLPFFQPQATFVNAKLAPHPRILADSNEIKNFQEHSKKGGKFNPFGDTTEYLYIDTIGFQQLLDAKVDGFKIKLGCTGKHGWFDKSKDALKLFICGVKLDKDKKEHKEVYVRLNRDNTNAPTTTSGYNEFYLNQMVPCPGGKGCPEEGNKKQGKTQ